jgi:hypothetical protein
MAFYPERGFLLFGNSVGLCMLSFNPPLQPQDAVSASNPVVRWGRATSVAELECCLVSTPTTQSETRNGVSALCVTSGFALRENKHDALLAPAVALAGTMNGSIFAFPISETGRPGRPLSAGVGICMPLRCVASS